MSMYAFIQGWMLQLTGIGVPSSCVKASIGCLPLAGILGLCRVEQRGKVAVVTDRVGVGHLEFLFGPVHLNVWLEATVFVVECNHVVGNLVVFRTDA